MSLPLRHCHFYCNKLKFKTAGQTAQFWKNICVVISLHLAWMQLCAKKAPHAVSKLDCIVAPDLLPEYSRRLLIPV
jgi:hypothetical protein